MFVKQKYCVSYATSASYPTKELIKTLKETFDVVMFRDVLFIHNIDAQGEGAFIFPYGVVVMWGLSQEGEARLFNQLKIYEQDTNAPTAREATPYKYGAPQLSVVDDCIMLPSQETSFLLAVSHGLAQSIKMCVFELIVRNTIDSTRSIPESLAKDGKISLSRQEIRRKMGTLFIDRSSINLHFDALDVPEYFWDHVELEPLYTIIANHFDLETRLEVLNQRLDVIHDLFEMLGNELNHQHSSRLEWIVIGLIGIEVLLAISRQIHLVMN